MTPEETLTTHLANNSYPGRGLVIGRGEDNDWHIIYWIMGRSEHSRNRKFVKEGNTLRTEARDPALVEDPSLIIYEAMLDLPGIYLVSNGDQTRTLYDNLRMGNEFDDGLVYREREPDAPNYTPRISGMLRPKSDQPITLSILKANAFDPALTDRYTYRPSAPPAGVGYGLTTYMGDGSPLPSFHGDPLTLPCAGSGRALLATYWDALDADNRIALAIKTIERNGDVMLRIKNG